MPHQARRLCWFVLSVFFFLPLDATLVQANPKKCAHGAEKALDTAEIRISRSVDDAELDAALVRKVLDEDDAARATGESSSTKGATDDVRFVDRADELGAAGKKAETRSLKHQDDVVDAVVDTKIGRTLEEDGFDTKAFRGGVTDSDMGKLASYKKLLTEPSPKSDMLLRALTGRGPPKTVKALRELLDAAGFEERWLLNSNLAPDKLRELFRNYPVLQGYLHELPGMADAIVLFERGVLTEAQFKKRIMANLFHNGPEGGIESAKLAFNDKPFWERLTKTFVPGALDNPSPITKAKMPEAPEFFKGTVFEGTKNQAGVIVPNYPSPVSFEGATHAFFDRMSQATKGGVLKIFEEIRHFPGPSQIAKMQDLLFNNPVQTRMQIEKLAHHVSHMKDVTKGGRTKYSRLADAGAERIKQYEQYVGRHVEVVKEGDAVTKLSITTGGKKTTFAQRTVTKNGKAVTELTISTPGEQVKYFVVKSSDGKIIKQTKVVRTAGQSKAKVTTVTNAEAEFGDELAKTAEKLLSAEEKLNGDPMRTLKI